MLLEATGRDTNYVNYQNHPVGAFALASSWFAFLRRALGARSFSFALCGLLRPPRRREPHHERQ